MESRGRKQEEYLISLLILGFVATHCLIAVQFLLLPAVYFAWKNDEMGYGIKWADGKKTCARPWTRGSIHSIHTSDKGKIARMYWSWVQLFVWLAFCFGLFRANYHALFEAPLPQESLLSTLLRLRWSIHQCDFALQFIQHQLLIILAKLPRI